MGKWSDPIPFNIEAPKITVAEVIANQAIREFKFNTRNTRAKINHLFSYTEDGAWPKIGLAYTVKVGVEELHYYLIEDFDPSMAVHWNGNLEILGIGFYCIVNGGLVAGQKITFRGIYQLWRD